MPAITKHKSVIVQTACFVIKELDRHACDHQARTQIHHCVKLLCCSGRSMFIIIITRRFLLLLLLFPYLLQGKEAGAGGSGPQGALEH
jgi:hypothetical protein